MYLREHWYVAALSSELETKPISRQILGEHVAIFRTRRARSLHSRISALIVATLFRWARWWARSWCAVITDSLLTAKGRALPFQDRTAFRGARVKTYPIVQQGLWVWIWMGRGEAGFRGVARDALVAGRLRDGRPSRVSPRSTPRLICSSTICSTSHTKRILHNGSIGTPEVASTPIDVEVDEEMKVVRCFATWPPSTCPPFYSRTTGLVGKVDRWQDIEYFAPGFYLLNARIAPVDEPPLADGSDDHAFHMKILYGLTPSSDGKVIDFWALSRDFCIGDRKWTVS